LQVVWTAWLAAFGHGVVDSFDTSDLVGKAAEGFNWPGAESTAALARSISLRAFNEISPFFARAEEAVQVGQWIEAVMYHS
jgi:hypothetical protein